MSMQNDLKTLISTTGLNKCYNEVTINYIYRINNIDTLYMVPKTGQAVNDRPEYAAGAGSAFRTVK